MSENPLELIPSARRLIRSLRDMGYDFPAAVADVIDNSIEARATRIQIDITFSGDASTVRIADDGTGMTPAGLREALRYGAERDYDLEDLGRFGLGLKTASMSQCERLTVASRSSDIKTDIYAYSWDLGHIERTNKWEILSIEKQDMPAALREPLLETTGTVVYWERLDRILGYKHPYGEMSKKRLSSMCRDLEAHLSMVFHRYLVGGYQKRIQLWLNGNRIEPWDPFAAKETATKKLDAVIIPFEHEGKAGKVVIEPWVLPHQEAFSSPEAHQRSSGPDKWNRQQGFYIYRAGRMIQSGGWCNLRTLDEHLKLARIALFFTPALDEAFKINVPKMRVQLPAQIKAEIEKAIAPVLKLAQARYRKSESKPSTASPSSITSPAKSSPRAADYRVDSESDLRRTTHFAAQDRADSRLSFFEFSELVRGTAKPLERDVVDAVLHRAEKLHTQGNQ